VDTFTPSITPTICVSGILGNTGGSSSQFSGGSTIYASRYELLQDGTVYNMNVYIESAPPGSEIMVGIYTDAAGQPDSLVVPSWPQEVSAGWNEIDIPTIFMAKGFYWLAVQGQTAVSIFYTPGGATDGVATSNIFGTLPDPFGSISNQARQWSLYADFCADAGYLVTATVTPTTTPTYTVTPVVSPTATQTSTPTPTATQQPMPTPAPNDSYVYPLPAEDEANFVFGLSEAADVTVSIFDFAGNLVAEKTGAGTVSSINTITVDTSRLSTGIYYYIITAVPSGGTPVRLKVNKFIIKRQ